MAKCTKGKSCGNTCVAPSYTCRKTLGSPSDLQAMFEDFNRRMAEEREKRIENEWERMEDEAQKRVNNFMSPTEDEVLPELTEREKDFRDDKIEEAQAYVEMNPLVPYEDRDVDWEDVVRTGNFLGKGSYGSAFAKGDIVVKVGEIWEEEIGAGVEASKLGIGPKIYQGPVAGIRGRGVVVMERVQGQEWHRFSQDMEKYPPEFQVKVADSFYDNMKTMHRAGMVHNDLNSGNVIVQHNGSVKFIDFAFADQGDQYRAGEEAHNSPIVSMARRPNVWVSPRVEGFTSRLSDMAEEDYEQLDNWGKINQLYDQH